MTNEQKYYQILKNLLDVHADLSFTWDHDKEEYELRTTSINQGWWHLSMVVDYIHAILRCEEPEKTWYILKPEDVDDLIYGLRDSYFDYLLDGIE